VSCTIERVEPGIIRIALSSWQGRRVGYEVSAYVLRGVLVDTGFPKVRAEVLDVVRTMEPRGAIVTHWHEDHAGNAQTLVAAGIPLLMHPRCESALRAHRKIGLYRKFVWGQAPRLSLPLVGFDPAPLTTLETPGHTDDHLVVWDEEHRVLVTGDLFIGVKVRVAHLHERPTTVVRSLRAVAALEPRLLLDAHRGPVGDVANLLQAKIDWMDETIGIIKSLAGRGIGEREIQRRVLGKEDLVGYASFGEYSKRAYVRSVLTEQA
jgi:glyoxylase-like metal-dependent hydrolase (beta-lactamase superfamily II)